MNERKLSVVVVGLRFGAEFVPIYKDHPSVREVAVADLDGSLCEKTRKRFGIAKSYASLEEVLADQSVDAVHIVTGLARHAPEAVSALDAGKHVAHPHLVHEFISSVVEGRQPAVDSLTAANWTAVGIAAHQSSPQKGKYVDIPTFI